MDSWYFFPSYSMTLNRNKQGCTSSNSQKGHASENCVNQSWRSKRKRSQSWIYSKLPKNKDIRVLWAVSFYKYNLHICVAFTFPWFDFFWQKSKKSYFTNSIVCIVTTYLGDPLRFISLLFKFSEDSFYFLINLWMNDWFKFYVMSLSCVWGLDNIKKMRLGMGLSNN